jgi:hypothetical protein
MQDLSTHKTRDLPLNAKEVLEKLLGRRLADDEEISIWASRPHSAPTGEARQEAWQQLNSQLDRMSSKAHGAREELEKLVDEISEDVRRKPRR